MNQGWGEAKQEHMSQMMNANNMMNEEYKQAMTQQQHMMMMHQQEWQKAEE